LNDDLKRLSLTGIAGAALILAILGLAMAVMIASIGITSPLPLSTWRGVGVRLLLISTSLHLSIAAAGVRSFLCSA
jgi:type III secretory pathway component EscV